MKILPELFLKSKIKEYYEKNPVEIKDIEKREFGYGVFGKKIANRNLFFKTNAELNYFLKTKVPFFLSYSVAYYEKPADRKDKGFLGQDLVFEFDADDIPTQCKKIHDSWKCEKCGEQGRGHVKKCPNCGAAVRQEEWICDNCLNATKKQTKKLYKVLTEDFDFLPEEISIMFSGHKGFHVKIKSPKVYDLLQNQRLEIMNYISEDGLSFKEIGFVPDDRGSIKYIGENFGKGYKYLNVVINAIKNLDIFELSLLFDTSTRTVKKIVDNKEKVVNDLKKGIFFKPKVDSVSLWYNFLDNLKEKQRLYIDKQTTVDVKKIVRAENTIHGGSMLVSKLISIDELDDFNPFEDATSFKNGKIRVKLKKIPKLLLNKQEFGPYENEVVELPTQYALYFIAKGAVDEIII